MKMLILCTQFENLMYIYLIMNDLILYSFKRSLTLGEGLPGDCLQLVMLDSGEDQYPPHNTKIQLPKPLNSAPLHITLL